MTMQVFSNEIKSVYSTRNKSLEYEVGVY